MTLPSRRSVPVRAAFLAVLVSLVSVLAASAQSPGVPGGGVGYNAVVARLFNDIPAFTATVETALTNAEDKSRLVIPMKMSKREDRLRIEVNFGKMTGTSATLQGLTAMEKFGMARMVSIVSPADRAMLVLFPDLRAAARVGLSDADLPNASFKLAKKALGKDTLNGQQCVRQQVVLTAADGSRNEATTWESPALGGFPVRIFFRPEGSAMAMNFSEVGLAAPDESMFRVPPGYRTFDTVPLLMQEAMAGALKPGK